MAENVDRNGENADPTMQVDKSTATTGTNDLGSTVARPNGLDSKPQKAFEERDQLGAEGGDSAQKGVFTEERDGKDNQDECLIKQEFEGEGGKQAASKDDDDDDDPFAGLDDVSSMDIYDLSNYTFGKKNEETRSKAMKQLSKEQVTEALRKTYSERGMRRSVGAVLLVHSHNFPHVLLLQRNDGKGEYALPGGRLRPGESDEEGLQRKLSSKLKPPLHGEGEDDQELDIGEKRTISMHTFLTKAFPLTKENCAGSLYTMWQLPTANPHFSLPCFMPLFITNVIL